jgi:hypothetical protein
MNKIGIWEANNDEPTSYVRVKNRDWLFWADNDIIPPKTKKRVLLMGESVARGLLLDPFYNPAKVLQELLDLNFNHEFEIIDLARSDLKLYELRNLFHESLRLSPDAIVFFAGNNWIFDAHASVSREDIDELILSLNNDGIGGFRGFLEKKLKKIIEEVFDEFGNISKEKNIKLFFIIPEYNLADWLEYKNKPNNSFLTEDQISSWKNITKQIHENEKAEDYQKVIQLSKQLIDIDPNNSFGHFSAGKGCQKTGDLVKSYSAFKQALDCSIVSRSIGKPRILTVIQEAIVNHAESNNINIINLPEIFRAFKRNSLPDRKLFFDYCHLTTEGIQLAMSYTASLLLQILVGKNIAADYLIELSKKIVPSNEVLAKAHLFAAIHNAHYGQTHNIILYHCEQAIKADTGILTLMKDYAKLTTLKAPNVICKEYENIVKNSGDRQYAALNHPRNEKLMDVVLVDAIVECFENEQQSIKKEINSIRQHEHSAYRQKINLLESFYSMSYYNFRYSKTSPFFEEIETNSTFYLISKENRSLELSLVYKVPGATSHYEDVTLHINGFEVANFPSVLNFTKIILSISGKYIKDGVNILNINWPVHEKRMQLEYDSIDDSVIANFINPCVGQIHEFYAYCIHNGDLLQ